MDIRAELRGFLQKYGHNVYLRRVTNEYTEEDERKEYSKTLEKRTVRSMNVLASRFLGDTKTENEEGIEYPTEMVFWFEYDVNPTSGDLIYENIPRYPNDMVVYEIDFADPKRGQNGRIEFWACGCTKVYPE